ncbi:hypothetical protein T4A_2143 [Trichinella pseudospiralis]|uniref:Uncharacterized protein n=1 Tax=Trichinella pseudospiralis TaxID=6337 RepID=A0A0V1EEI7_TRIPS|nr:hypothetical protein T4A_2143 [Trichinella pseudospiralis]
MGINRFGTKQCDLLGAIYSTTNGLFELKIYKTP